MNYIDVLILVALIWFGYKGFTKGLVIELVGVVALTLGVYGGLKFSDTIARLITDSIEDKYVPIISFTITFVIIVVVVFVIGKMIEKIINLASLKLLNKLAGAAFGILKVGLIISVLLTIVESYDQKLHFLPQETKNESLFYVPMLSLADNVLPTIEKSRLLDDFNLSTETDNTTETE